MRRAFDVVNSRAYVDAKLSLFLLRRKNVVEAQPTENGDVDSEIRKLMAAEESSMKGFFGRIIEFYERWLRRALEHPWWLAGGAAVLVIASIGCFLALGSDLLPEMDEGGFILDYLTPPGSSLQETDRIVGHLEKMLQDTPEVESTSRRTGLQLGLAA